MSGSTIGTIFKITTWGESHGQGIGAVIDGCPAGVPLHESDIQMELDKRKPGGAYATKRNEPDIVQILSGVFEGKTTGAPLSLMIHNKDHRSIDYSDIMDIYRPGHADFTFDAKYGFRDYRGGGRSSGRETAARVAAGAVATRVLSEIGIDILCYTQSIGSIRAQTIDRAEIENNPLKMPDAHAYRQASEYLRQLMAEGNSAGGSVKCVVSNVPKGLGEPVFDKLDANLAKAMFSIGGVKGFEIGIGVVAATQTGAANNDPFYYDSGLKRVIKTQNNAGGILGGMSDGSDIVCEIFFKPTPSISLTQRTVNKQSENVQINIKGRHDPTIVPRAVPVVAAMAAVTFVDLLLINMSSKMERIKKFYQ